MYILTDGNDYIRIMSKELFEGAIETPEPDEDVVKWFATKKYKFINNEYVLQENWEEPTVSL